MMRLIWVSLLAILTTGCATVNRGATDYFRIDTVPQGASATTTIETRSSLKARENNPDLAPQFHSCEPTPCAIALSRRSEFVVKLEHPEHQPTELFITNSGSNASYSANAAATVATTAGTVAVTAPIAAGLATTLNTITLTTVNASLAAGANLSTLGLVSFESAFAVANSTIAATPTTTSSVVAGAVPPALAVTGAMLLTDMATGANLNLYPNPVVIGLAPKGVQAKIDPNVAGFKNLLKAKKDAESLCRLEQKNTPQKTACKAARNRLSEIKADRRKRLAEAKKLAKEAPREQKLKLRQTEGSKSIQTGG